MKIYKFTASYCGACKQLEKLLEPFRGKITEVSVDTEEGVEIANKYGVRGNLPVVIVEDNGEVLDVIAGLHPLEAYEKWLKG